MKLTRHRQLAFPGMAPQATNTRNDAWRLLQDKLAAKQYDVYHKVWYLRFEFPNGMTDKQIADAMGLTINRVTGRVRELTDAGLFVQNGKVVQNGRRVRRSMAVPIEDLPF